MNYQTYPPHPDLASLVKCYWTLEVPQQKEVHRQRIVPDGCMEMVFMLGEDVKRFINEKEFVLQPRQMLMGQITEAFYIEPTGYVSSFAVRFYPYGFANFVSTPIQDLANKDAPLAQLFGEEIADGLAIRMNAAEHTQERIAIVEDFLLMKLNEKTTLDNIVQRTVETMFQAKGSLAINEILQENLGERRQLERKFRKQIGLSPKQLSKVFRLQAALKMLLNQQAGTLAEIAYESDFYDQAHFIKDFKEFTGTTPNEFLENDEMTLSSIIYKDS